MASDVFGGGSTDNLLTNGASVTPEIERRKLRKFSVHEVGFFEGPEKLLEVWFDLCPFEDDKSCDNGSALLMAHNHDKGLRIFPREKWEELLKLVSCDILSSCSNGYMDAYLLSESSLFVSSNRFILKTCGNTTLLHAVKPLFEMVDDFFPGNQVMAFFYSHRNFQKPQLQLHPHRSFEEEVRYLDEIFDDGAAYVLGRMNRDAWYLYTVCEPQLPSEHLDQTLEILMTDLDPEIMALYSSAAYSSDKQLMRDTGIDQIIPGAILDSKIFEPCGFSVNAIIKGDEYFTIHVTPQVECSWVSFETNLLIDSHSALMAKVLAIFKPGSFTFSLFVSKNANLKVEEPFAIIEDAKIQGYRCKDKQCCRFESYDLTFGHFTQVDKLKNKPCAVAR